MLSSPVCRFRVGSATVAYLPPLGLAGRTPDNPNLREIQPMTAPQKAVEALKFLLDSF